MKIVFAICLLLFPTPLSWGTETLFSFLRDHQLGSKVTEGKEGFSELPDVEIFGRDFSAYQEIDPDGKIRKVGLYLRSNSANTPAPQMQGVFDQIRKSIISQSGESEAIEVPNFQDATERTGSLYSWKNGGGILILEIVQSPSRTEIIIQHSNFDYFIANLGADTGAYLLPKLEANSGDLNISASAPSPQEPESEDPTVEQDQKPESRQEPDGLASGDKSPQSEPTSHKEKSETPTWVLILGAIAVLGVAVILVRAFIRGRAS